MRFISAPFCALVLASLVVALPSHVHEVKRNVTWINDGDYKRDGDWIPDSDVKREQ